MAGNTQTLPNTAATSVRIERSAVSDRIAGNFPLDIQGIDLASGQMFHYQYDTSSQTVTIVPEPSTYVMAAAGTVALLLCSRRR